MSKKLRIIAIALALVLVVGMMPLSIFAADEAETPETPSVRFENPYYDLWTKEEYAAAGVTFKQEPTLKYTNTGSGTLSASSKKYHYAYYYPATADSAAYYLIEMAPSDIAPFYNSVQNEDGSWTVTKYNWDEKRDVMFTIMTTANIDKIANKEIVEIDGVQYYKSAKTQAPATDTNYYWGSATYTNTDQQVNHHYSIMAGAAFGEQANQEILRFRYYFTDTTGAAPGNDTKQQTWSAMAVKKMSDGLHILINNNDTGIILRKDVYTDIMLSTYIKKDTPEAEAGALMADIYINGVKVLDAYKLKDNVKLYRCSAFGAYWGTAPCSPLPQVTLNNAFYYEGEVKNLNENPFTGIEEVENGYYVYENSLCKAFINPDNYVEVKNATVTSGENLGIDLTVALPKNVAVTKAVITYDDGTVAPPAEEGGAATAVPQTKEFVFADMTPNADGTYTISYVTPAGASISDGFTLEFYNVTPGVDGASDVETKVSVLEGTKVVETYNTNVFAALKTAIELGDKNLAAAINAVTQDLEAKTAALEVALANKMDALEVSNSIRDLRTQLEGLYKAADDALREQIDGVSKEVTDLKTALEAAKTTLNGAIEQLRTDLENKTAELAAAIATKADNTEMLTKYSELKSAYEAADLVLESNDEALAAADAAMAAAIAELKKTVDDHAARLDSIDTMNTVKLVLIIVVAIVAITALVLPIVKGKKKED